MKQVILIDKGEGGDRKKYILHERETLGVRQKGFFPYKETVSSKELVRS